MKKLSFLDKIILFFNSIFAALLLLSYFLPLVPPKSFGFISVLSLFVPVLILINLVFFIFWLVRFKKQFFLSLLVLLIGYKHVFGLYQFSSSPSPEEVLAITHQLKLLTYNVRNFAGNQKEWSKGKGFEDSIVNFVKTENPDVVCFEEFYPNKTIEKLSYPFHVANHGVGLYSKFPIINKGELNVDSSVSGIIYADLAVNNDTIRIYAVHLQSLGVTDRLNTLENNEGKYDVKNDSKFFLKHISKGFWHQQTQMEVLQQHLKNYPNNKTIICGDFNNTAYSYLYKKIRGDRFKDAFLDEGSGFGKTYEFKYFPLRIDYILTDDVFQVSEFKNYYVKFSDHYPISASFYW
ncbi:endonuclease/exonuclease/phosphatase family protein [Zhouia sp. PK063]|uniref:endonuclease/exonuclease/phosphatase family protein n=1 Tax=Zhouia sp. PK063 TaxID=3373602 RepID=UPI00379219D5